MWTVQRWISSVLNSFHSLSLRLWKIHQPFWPSVLTAVEGDRIPLLLLVNTQVGKWRLDFFCDHNKCTLSLQGSQKLGDFHLSHKQTSGVYYLPSALWPQGIAEKQKQQKQTHSLHGVLSSTSYRTLSWCNPTCWGGRNFPNFWTHSMTRLLQWTAGYNWSSKAIFIICDTVLVAGLSSCGHFWAHCPALLHPPSTRLLSTPLPPTAFLRELSQTGSMRCWQSQVPPSISANGSWGTSASACVLRRVIRRNRPHGTSEGHSRIKLIANSSSSLPWLTLLSPPHLVPWFPPFCFLALLPSHITCPPTSRREHCWPLERIWEFLQSDFWFYPKSCNVLKQSEFLPPEHQSCSLHDTPHQSHGWWAECYPRGCVNVPDTLPVGGVIR